MKEREIIAREWRDENGIIHRREVGQELVRCKECKWRGIPTACPIDNFYAQRWTKDDDFCSYGERRE